MNHALIPAAGRSSRLGRSKVLLPFGDTTVLGTLLATLERGGVDRSWIVAAAGDLPLVRFCEHGSISYAVNRRPQLGMLSSIRSGLEALAPGLGPDDVVLICPVDFPTIRAKTVARVLAQTARAAAGIAVASRDGRRGHPLAFRAPVTSEILQLDPDVGLRQIYDRLPVLDVEVDDPGIQADLDTWQDYAALTDI